MLIRDDVEHLAVNWLNISLYLQARHSLRGGDSHINSLPFATHQSRAVSLRSASRTPVLPEALDQKDRERSVIVDSKMKICVASCLAAACTTQAIAQVDLVRVEFTGEVIASIDEWNIFPGVVLGQEASGSFVFDPNQPLGSGITLKINGETFANEDIFPRPSQDRLSIRGQVRDIPGVRAAGNTFAISEFQAGSLPADRPPTAADFLSPEPPRITVYVRYASLLTADLPAGAALIDDDALIESDVFVRVTNFTVSTSEPNDLSPVISPKSM